MAVNVDKVVALCVSQEGDEYEFGAEASISDTNPEAFDCSELIQWSCGRAGVEPTMPDGSWIQARHCKNHDSLFSVEEGIDTRGALLFRFVGDPFTGGRPSSAHVAMSLGNGTTIEARSSRHGVGIFTTAGRGWTHAGLVPGAYYPDVKYNGVLHVPNTIWAKAVVDWNVSEGVIITGDEYPDDWEDDDITMGRIWTLIYRRDN